MPELAGANVVGHRVGLRPVRPVVRLDAEGRVIHCYGHGGAGVTAQLGLRRRGEPAWSPSSPEAADVCQGGGLAVTG